MVEVESPDEETDLAREVAVLAETPAGPDLAALLAGLDIAAVTDSECVEVLRARYRQASHERGELFAVITEVVDRVSRDSESPQHEHPDWQGTAEVGAALVLTTHGAEDLCGLATDVVRRLPGVQAALTGGVIDQPRARVFSIWTGELSDEHAAAVVAALLPRAPRLTTSALVAAIRRHAIALDPNWARRRYEKALRGRRVAGFIRQEGTATLAGYDLPADQVAAACARLDALARAAKHAGHPAPIDHLRADLFLGMTDGSYAGLDDTHILARLIATIPPHPEASTEASSDTEASTDPEAGPDTEPSTDTEPRPDTAAAADAESGHEAGPHTDAGSETGAADADDLEGMAGSAPGEQAGPQPGAADECTVADATSAESTSAESTVETPDPTRPDPAADEAMAACAATDSTAHASPVDSPGPPAVDSNPDGPSAGLASPTSDVPDAGLASPALGGAGVGASVGLGVRGGQLRLLVGLGCLAGLDALPGELVGWGPVHAELARTMATARGASWWYVLAGPDGCLRDVGVIRRRPTETAGADLTRPGYRGLQVWVQVTEAMLAALAADPPPGWGGVLAEIVDRATASPGGPANGNPRDRVPNAALRRWLCIRDRYCTFPTCRVPAHRCDADHSVEHANHGPTTDANLAAACRRHHRLRHVGGWSVTQTKPGHLTWTSPLGHTYQRTPPPGPDDLPEPMPHPTPDTDDNHPDQHDPDRPDADWQNDTCLYIASPPPPPPPPPPPAPEPARATSADDDIPPF